MPPLYATRTLGIAGAGDPDEIVAVENAQRRRKRKKRKEAEFQANPQIGENARDLRRAYPSVPPEAIQRFARQGRGVDDPLVQRFAEATVRAQAKTGRTSRPGERQRGNPTLPAQDPLATVGNLRTARGGEMGLGQVIDAITPAIPNPFGTDKYGGGAMSGETLRRATDEYAPPEVSSTIRGVSRGAMLAAQVPLDLVHAGVRDTANRISQLTEGRPETTVGQNVSDPFALRGAGRQRVPLWEQSQGLQAAADLAAGEDVDVGAGWFPDPGTRTGRAAARASRQAAPTIGGHGFTLGRYVANQFFDPDTVPFDIMSGAVDAAVAVKADPTNSVFDLYTSTRRAGKTFAAAGLTEEGGAAWTASRRADDAIAAARRNPDDLDLAARAREAQVTARELSDQAVTAARADAGAFEGHRPWVSPRTAQQWLTTKGKPVVEWSVKNTDPYESWLLWQKKGPREMHVALAQAGDESQVAQVFARYLGQEVRDLPKPGRIPGTGRSTVLYEPLDNQRWTQMAPKESAITPARPAVAIEEADRYARNANLTRDERKAAVTPFFTAKTYDDYYDATTGLLEQVKRKLIDDGIPERAADELTTFTHHRNRALRKYGIDDVSGENLDQPFALLGDGNIPAPSPHLPTEMLSQAIPLPDFRAVRRATRTIGGDAMRLRRTAQTQVEMAAGLIGDETLAERVARRGQSAAFGAVSPHTGRGLIRATKGGAREPITDVRVEAKKLGELARLVGSDSPEAAGLLRSASRSLAISAGDDWAKAAAGGVLEGFGELWRRAKLFRPAWGLRVVGEEQARMWAYGGIGMWDHPIHAIGIVAGSNPEGRLARLLSKTPGQKPALVADVSGAPLGASDDLAEAMNESFGILYTDAVQRVRGPSTDMWVVANRGDDSYWQGLAEEAARLHVDPVARKVAGLSRDEARAYFRGEGADLWKSVARDSREARVGGIEKSVADMTDAEREVLLDTYLDSVERRIEGVTQGDTRVRSAIADGTLDGTSLKPKNGRVDSGISDSLARLDGYQGPAKVRVREQIIHPKGSGRAEALAQAFDSAMWNLMPRPSNYLSRSPFFRQNYWDRISELGPSMDPRALRKAVDSGERMAGSAGWEIPEGLSRLKGMKGTPGGLTMKEADRLSKAHALERTQETLYDLSERGQFFDALREVFPFGEAWKEVLTRWSRAVYENPKVWHRLDQGVQSAREAGIITKDPTTGQEVVVYPGSDWITDKIIGVPVPLTGSVQGVNIASAGLPGVGPAVSLPLPYVAKAIGWNLDEPGATRDLMEIIYPYGRNDTGMPDRDLIDQLAPTWLARGLKATRADDPSTRSTLNYMLNYLASSGDYDLHGPDAVEETNRMIKDATKKAKQFQVVRAVASSVAPSAPIPKWMLRDKDNKLVEMQVVREKYQKILADPERGEDEAFQWLLDTYGPDSFLTSQAFTRANGLNLPRTRKQADWMVGREHLREKYPSVYGLIIPPDDKGEFDITEYFAQTRRTPGGGKPERENLTPKERVTLANQRLGSYVYDRAVSLVGDAPTPEDTKRLAKLDQMLADEYPGYQPHGARDYKAFTPNAVREITTMVNDPSVKSDPDTRDIASLVRTYLKGRSLVIREQETRGLSGKGVSTAKGAADLREKLRNLQALIRKRDKRFGYFADYVFSRETEEPA